MVTNEIVRIAALSFDVERATDLESSAIFLESSAICLIAMFSLREDSVTPIEASAIFMFNALSRWAMRL